MITKFVFFDVRNLIIQGKRVLPAILLMIAIASTMLPAFAVLTAGIVVGLISSTPFYSDERGRLDALYSTLPITRTTVVVGRYLTLLVLYIGVAAIGNAASVIASAARHLPLQPGLLATMNVAGFLILVLALGIQLPFFFALGYTRARLMAFLPGVIVLGPIVILTQTGVLHMSSFSAVMPSDSAPLSLVAILGAIAALVVSGTIARALYIRRQL